MEDNVINITVDVLNSKYMHMLNKFKFEKTKAPIDNDNTLNLFNQTQKENGDETIDFNFNDMNNGNKDIKINLKKKVNLLKADVSSSNPLIGLDLNDDIYKRIEFKLMNQFKNQYLNSKLFQDINENTNLMKRKKMNHNNQNPFKGIIHEKEELLVNNEIHNNIIKAKNINLLERLKTLENNKISSFNIFKDDLDYLNEVISDFLLLTSKIYCKNIYVMISTILVNFRNCYNLLRDKLKIEFYNSKIVCKSNKTNFNKDLNLKESSNENICNINNINNNELICNELRFTAKFVNFFISDYSSLKLPSIDYLLIMIVISYFLDWCFLMKYTGFKMII